MGLSTFTTIVLFLVCLAGGIAIGFLLARYLRSTMELPAEEMGERKPAYTKETKAVNAPDTALLRVGRTKKKAIWLEMGDQLWEAGSELPPGERQKLNAIVQDLGPWLEPPPPPVSSPEAYEPKPAKSSPFTRSASPGQNSKKGFTQPAKETASTGMIPEIDAILQQKLVGTPFANLDIHILEGPLGEVNVQVGAMKHPGVESIPNHEIQAFIRESVAEWEKRTQ